MSNTLDKLGVDRSGGDILCMCSKLGFSWKKKMPPKCCARIDIETCSDSSLVQLNVISANLRSFRSFWIGTSFKGCIQIPFFQELFRTPVIFGVYLCTLFRFVFLSLSSLSRFLLFFHWLAQALSLSFFLSRARANPFLTFSIQMHIFPASNLSHLVHLISLSHTHIHMHMHATCTQWLHVYVHCRRYAHHMQRVAPRVTPSTCALQDVVGRCSVLQGVAGCCRVLQGVAGWSTRVAGCCKVL